MLIFEAVSFVTLKSCFLGKLPTEHLKHFSHEQNTKFLLLNISF